MSVLRNRWEKGEWGLGQIVIMPDEREAQYKKEQEEYCSQNDGNCLTCALVNYDRDCHNNAIRKQVYHGESLQASVHAL